MRNDAGASGGWLCGSSFLLWAKYSKLNTTRSISAIAATIKVRLTLGLPASTAMTEMQAQGEVFFANHAAIALATLP
jgi:hypothetical protein